MLKGRLQQHLHRARGDAEQAERLHLRRGELAHQRQAVHNVELYARTWWAAVDAVHREDVGGDAAVHPERAVVPDGREEHGDRRGGEHERHQQAAALRRELALVHRGRPARAERREAERHVALNAPPREGALEQPPQRRVREERLGAHARPQRPHVRSAALRPEEPQRGGARAQARVAERLRRQQAGVERARRDAEDPLVVEGVAALVEQPRDDAGLERAPRAAAAQAEEPAGRGWRAARRLVEHAHVDGEEAQCQRGEQHVCALALLHGLARQQPTFTRLLGSVERWPAGTSPARTRAHCVGGNRNRMASSEAVRAAQTPLPAGLVHMWINRGQNGFGIYFKHVTVPPRTVQSLACAAPGAPA